MKTLNITVLILTTVFLFSCATKKTPTFPKQAEQEELSEDFEKNPEGKKTFSEYLTHKTQHSAPTICVESDHDDIGHWEIHSKDAPQKPLAITMQMENHRYQCATVPVEAKNLFLKVEAFGKDGIYHCKIKVKIGDHVKVHAEGHHLVCGSEKGAKVTYKPVTH